MSLPRSLEELRGLRAARWIRESTRGQYDAFGPEAQREQQDRALERWGLVDSDAAWQVAHSGRTVGSTAQFADMMARAGRDYDVLVVGYVSRFARDLRTAVNARHDLHAAGACILFADERILSSDEERWDEWAREAVEAESYSRKLGRRIREGYAAKRRRLGEPGGRPPFGWLREGRPPRLVADPERLAIAARAYARCAAGARDRDIARDLELPIDTVRGILTNPIYAGQLRDGTPASVEAVVDRRTWQAVQELRAGRFQSDGRPATRRTYLLPMLRCAGCGRRLIGNQGRYRHPDPCEAFTAARPRQAYRNRLRRSPGQSYPRQLYEGWVGLAIAQTALDVDELTDAAELYAGADPPVDELALRRIGRDRERALARYAASRDIAALEAAMARLDAEERQARTAPAGPPPWSEVVGLLRDLPGLWRQAEPAERRQLAESLIASCDALGGRELAVNFRLGVRAVVRVGATGVAPTVTTSRAPVSTERSA